MQPLFDTTRLTACWHALPGKTVPRHLARIATQIKDELNFRLDLTTRSFETTLVLAHPLLKVDESLRALPRLSRLILTTDPAMLLSDNAALEPASVDLILTLGLLQHINDVPGLLAQYRRALTKGGLLLGCLAGGDTLHDLRRTVLDAESAVTGSAQARVHPCIDVKQMGALLQRAGFHDPVSDRERFELPFTSPQDMLQNLRAAGARNGLIARRTLRKDVLQKILEIYPRQHDATCMTTLDIVWFAGWA